MDKEDVVYIYTMEYYSSIRKKEIMPFATTGLNIILGSIRVNQKLYDLTYIYNLKENV